MHLLLLVILVVIGHDDSFLTKLKIYRGGRIVPCFPTLARKHATSLATLSSLLEPLFQVDSIAILRSLTDGSNAFGATTMLRDRFRGLNRRKSWLERLTDVALAVAKTIILINSCYRSILILIVEVRLAHEVFID